MSSPCATQHSPSTWAGFVPVETPQLQLVETYSEIHEVQMDKHSQTSESVEVGAPLQAKPGTTLVGYGSRCGNSPRFCGERPARSRCRNHGAVPEVACTDAAPTLAILQLRTLETFVETHDVQHVLEKTVEIPQVQTVETIVKTRQKQMSRNVRRCREARLSSRNVCFVASGDG